MRISRQQIALLALGLALVVSVVLRQAALRQPDQVLPERQTEEVAAALDFAMVDLDQITAGLAARAAQVAGDPAVRSGLSLLLDDEDGAVDALVQTLARRSLPDLVSIEIYDPTPRLRAWNGYSMPMDDAPGDPAFLAGPQLRVVQDGERRAALVAWHPVSEAGRVVGAVRTMRLVEVRVPVRNEYLSDVSIAEDWTLKTGLTLTATFGPGLEGTEVYRAPDGEPLVSVRALPPSGDDLRSASVHRIDHIIALWLAALLAFGAIWAIRLVRARVKPVRLRLLATGAVLLVLRFGWVLLRVPERWQQGKTPFAPLFDPVHVASGLGFGLFHTVGDIVLTSLVALAFAVLVLRDARRRGHGENAPGLLHGVGFAIGSGALFSLVALVVHRVVQDSTLDYFARSGLLPQRLVVIVFGAMLLLMLAASLASVAIGRMSLSRERGSRIRVGLVVLIASVAVALLAAFPPVQLGLGEQLALVLFVIGIYVLTSVFGAAESWTRSAYFLRSILLFVVLLALAMYPILDRSVEAKERQRMEDAAESYTEERDPRALLAIRQMVDAARDRVEKAPGQDPSTLGQNLEDVLRGSLLASLGTYEVSVAVLDDAGDLLGRTAASRTPSALARALQQDRADLALLRAIRDEQGAQDVAIEKITSAVELDRFDYIGIDQTLDGTWILVRASQHEHLPSGNTPFPRVLVPAGYYGSLYPDLSIAEYRDGVLVRSFGSAFGRSFMSQTEATALDNRPVVWRKERVRDRQYVTLYVRNRDAAWGRSTPSFGRSIIAVRRTSITVFDRLYYLLRLTVAGLALGIPVYLYGLLARFRLGELPSRRIRFRDKVLNAFLAVGLIVVVTMGWVGLRVVTGETDRAVESWLTQHLDRVEDALALRAGPDEMPYRVLERTDVDSLAAQVGLDLNVYLGVHLESTSRPQLVRDRLISQRIPIEAYNALFVSGFKFAAVEERLGRFAYTAGYRALSDEQGAPRYVVSVPTLPEQERIEEERSRTAAYLFGALLLLMMVVMGTAAFIATTLSRPIARLQRGLESVAEGHFEQIGPVRSRDEIADLVGTFNTMQDQLADSRRLLAQQERQLAWREMARQVAHEIKNPLTPMKLSVQHLRRAREADREPGKFSGIFERITTTLIDQIDALARIANEFASFARMPLQKPVPVDLNDVIREAVALMQEHARVDVRLALAPDPLRIEADPEALRRMYINFIKNALEAIEHDRAGLVTISTRIEEKPELGGRWAVSEVEDNGAGVPEDLRDRVFNPSFSTKTSGAGLGLAIAKSTVEELRGRIGFDTVEGEGSVFWVRFPLLTEQDADE